MSGRAIEEIAIGAAAIGASFMVPGAGVAVMLFIPMVLREGRFLFGPPQSWPGDWLLVSCMSIIPAFFVRIRRGKQQADGTARPLYAGAAPKVWAIFLLILLLTSTLLQLGPMPFAGGMFQMLVYSIALGISPALVVKIRNSDREAEGASEPSRNSLSPRVWIIITPVLFLVFCVEIEYIGLTDYPCLGEVFFTWLLTGLASLIILLAIKLGSRARATARAYPTASPQPWPLL